MTTAFPTGLDTTGGNLPNNKVDGVSVVPAATDNNQSDAIIALQTKVGINASAVTTTLDYQMENHAHTSAADDGALVDHGTLTNVAPDDHHPQSHGSDHSAGGADPIVGVPAVRTVGCDYFIYKSGPNYIAFKTDTGTTPYTSTNAASTINLAAANLVAGGLPGGKIQLEGKTTFNCTSGINIPGGVTLVGFSPPSEGNSNTPVIVASSNLGGGSTPGGGSLISLNGFGAGLMGVNVSAGSNATEAVCPKSAATTVWGGFITGGRVRCYGVQLSMPRQRVSDVRFDGNSNPSVSVCQFYSTDHVVSNIVATGCAPNGNALNVNGNNGEFTGMHLTGDSTSADTLAVDGDGNGFSSVKCDTAGSNSTALYYITGSHNTFAACSAENLATGINRPVIALQGSAWGNQFMGFEYAKAAGDGQAQGIIRFLTGAGATPANLSAFFGTKLFFSAANLDLVGGQIANRLPLATEPVWIEGYVNSGTASAPAGTSGNGYYNYYPNHS